MTGIGAVIDVDDRLQRPGHFGDFVDERPEQVADERPHVHPDVAEPEDVQAVREVEVAGQDVAGLPVER